MHSAETARIQKLSLGKDEFMKFSRRLAQQAQGREVVTDQPKENLTGVKATVTIRNYLGGYYCFTVDEIEIRGSDLYLIEGKHTKAKALPSASDIKEGLLKMILYTNLENVILNNQEYNVVPVLKLTTNEAFHVDALRLRQRKWLNLLKKEAYTNGFRININNQYLV